MRKNLIIWSVMAFALSASVNAQTNVFNHLGVDVSVGTTGIGAELSTPITNYLQLRAGASFIPSITFEANADGNVQISTPAGPRTEPFDMKVHGDVSRAQGDVVINVYPFGARNSLFVAAGAYFGGKSIIKLDGKSERVAQLQAEGILEQGWVEIGDYKVDFEENGKVRGAIGANSFRPYIGIGYGRPCPGKRVGFMVELGMQFMGKVKVFQGKDMQPIDISGIDKADDWQKWIDKTTLYPMLKFTLSGRIF